MQGAQNKECHFHKGEMITHYCTKYRCNHFIGRCKLCIDQIAKLNCKSAHLTKLKKVPQYFDNQKLQLEQYLTKLYSNNCWIQQVLQGIIKQYDQQIISIEQFNKFTLDNIKDLKKVVLNENSEVKIEGVLLELQIRNNFHLSINHNTMMASINYGKYSDNIKNLNEVYELLIKLQSDYVQNISSRKYLNWLEQPLDMNRDLEDILNSRNLIKEEINQQQVQTDSHQGLYPEFNKKLQEVQKLTQEQQYDQALTLSLQMIETHRNDQSYSADIFKQISQILQISEKYWNKYRKMISEYKTDEDKAHRMLSELHFDLKNYSQSLHHLTKVRQLLQRNSMGLYFIQSRFAQIYLKLKNREKLKEKIYTLSHILEEDSFWHYLLAKLKILEDGDKQEIIEQFEYSLEYVNTLPLFYQKYSIFIYIQVKYLNSIGENEKAIEIQQRYQQTKFIINSNNNDSNIFQENYVVNMN